MERGDRVTALLRLIVDGFGPREFGLESALPDLGDQIVASAAAELARRFRGAFDRLYRENRALLRSLQVAGYPLPRELRAPAELALGRELEADVQALAEGGGSAAVGAARDVVDEAAQGGFQLATPRAAAVLGHALLTAVERAVRGPTDGEDAVADALDLLHLAHELGLGIDVDRAQELVLDRLRAGDERIRPLAEALGIAV